jgi:hypothetical protein
MISMRRFPFSFPRAYRLRPILRGEDGALAQLWISAGAKPQFVLVPYSLGLGYFVAGRGRAALSIASGDFSVETLGFLPSLWVRLRLGLFFKVNKYLSYDEFSLFCFGPKPERKLFTRYNKDTMDIGVVVDGDLARKHPELLCGWRTTLSARPRMVDDLGPHPVAVVVHIYYEDTWPDVEGALERVTVPFDLIVTTTSGRERLIETIRGAYPHAQVDVMENRGRDVGPFVVLLERGRLDRYRYVCKIHGKKSIDGGRKSYMGAMWRRRLLFDLFAAPGRANAVVDMFERDPSIGMIGPRVFRLPRDTYSDDLSWSANRPMVLELAERMGVPGDKFRLDFFGGTMFWVRPEALKPLRELRLASEFAEEQGLLDGDLPHAIERALSTAVVAAGYRLENCDGFGPSEGGESDSVTGQATPAAADATSRPSPTNALSL